MQFLKEKNVTPLRMSKEETSVKRIHKEKDEPVKTMEISKVNEIILECKSDWEIARMKKCEKAKREKAISKIYEKIKGNIAFILRKRTGSKILQTIFKFANEETKDLIFEEIKNEIPSLSICSFSIFFLQKLLDTKYFKELVQIMGDNHKKIITDRIGAFFLDEVFQKLKKGPQKDFLRKLLGNKARIFYANTKLMDIPEKEFDFGNITRKMLDKGLSNLTIAHDLLNLHILHFESEEEQKIYVRGLVEFFIDFVHTINGRKIINRLLEDEVNIKKMVKQTKDHLSDMMKSTESRSILMDLIAKSEEKDAKKYIFKTIKENMATFLNTDNFADFVELLIEKEQFEYLKDKFIKELQRDDAEYGDRYKEIQSNL